MTPPNNELDEVEEDRFVYVTNEELPLPSLQEMASCQIALAIWNGYISRCSINQWEINAYGFNSFYLPMAVKFFGSYCTYKEDTDALVENLKAPRSIQKILKTSLKQVRKEMEKCIGYFMDATLFETYDDCNIPAFKPQWCFWLPNGKIDYLKTAETMVSPENVDLNLKTKFAIMCELYMEEKLKTFPLDSLPANFIKKLPFYSLPPDFIEKLALELLPVGFVKKIRQRLRMHFPEGDSCEVIGAMITDRISNNGIGDIWTTHVWHYLSDDDQVKIMYKILGSSFAFFPENWQTVELLFGTMSWDQQNRLLAMPAAGDRIIISSCAYSSSSKFTLWTWKHVRDSMTGDEFRNMMHRLFLYDYGKKDILSIMVELWDLAYDHHRNILVSGSWLYADTADAFGYRLQILHENWFFEKILSPDKYASKTVYHTSAAYILLNKSLALKSMEERKSLIMEHSLKLATGTLNPRCIQEVFDLNLPNIDDQNECKKSVRKSDDLKLHCATLLVNGNFDNVNAIVEFFCNGDLNSIRKYNRNLLSLVIHMNWARFGDKSVITDANKWSKCCEFIDDVFEDDPAEASVAKQQLVSDFLNGSDTNRFCKNFHQAIKTIESVFPNEIELKRVKTEFIEKHFKPGCEFWSQEDICDDEYFHRMIQWCCNDNEEAVEVLKNITETHDTIFNIVFFQLNKIYVTEANGLKMSLLNRLDKYLSWYLAGEDAIRAYKMCRLKESNKLRIFSTVLKRRDEESLRMLHEWFFDGDEAKIRDFRSKKIKCL